MPNASQTLNPAMRRASDWLAPLRRHVPLLERDRPGDGLERGTLSGCSVGGMHVFQLKASSAAIALGSPAGAAGPAIVLIQRSGSARLRCDGCDTELATGQMAVLKGNAEVLLRGRGWQTWILLPPRSLGVMAAAAGAAGALGCHPLQVRLVSALADELQALIGHACPPVAQQLAANALVSLLASALAGAARAAVEEPPDGGPAQQRPRLASFHVARIKRFLLDHLGDPELSVAKASHALNISPAHLHRLFIHEEMTFSAWLWDQRLLESRAALESHANRRLTISQIAFRYGFNNPSHFSRAFRARFGHTPSDIRRARQHGQAGAAAPAMATTPPAQ